MSDGERERLLEEIGRARERVVEFERAQAAEASRITELEAQLSALAAPTAEPAADAPGASVLPRAPDSKLQIFRGLFRGREDVYPTRFESAKTGKHGYGPACANNLPLPHDVALTDGLDPLEHVVQRVRHRHDAAGTTGMRSAFGRGGVTAACLSCSFAIFLFGGRVGRGCRSNGVDDLVS